MGSLSHIVYESLGISTYNWIVDIFNMNKPKQWINPDVKGKKYILHLDYDHRGPCVEEIRDDGYTSKLRLTKDKFWDFQAVLSTAGWFQV